VQPGRKGNWATTETVRAHAKSEGVSLTSGRKKVTEDSRGGEKWGYFRLDRCAPTSTHPKVLVLADKD